MKHWLLIALLVGPVSVGGAFQSAPARKARPKTAVTRSAIGCLDQRGETYVLAGDRELRRLVTLQGDGFSDDNFARYLGHKVKVQGRLSEPGSSVFRVRDIATISETCKPDER
jgi:hypothetical protein